jgi:hypothetical protein
MPTAKQKVTFRFILLTLVSFLLIVTDVAILVPFTVSRIRHESISLVLGEWDWLWSTAVNIAPALLLAGVALGNQVVATTQTNSEQTANREANHSPLRSPFDAESRVKRTYESLSSSDKYYILNAQSKAVAGEWGVTSRAVQKWRKKVQEEIAQGKL